MFMKGSEFEISYRVREGNCVPAITDVLTCTFENADEQGNIAHFLSQ